MSSHYNVPSMAPSDISMSTGSRQTANIQHQANTVQMDPVQVEMLKLLQQMQQSITNSSNNQGGGGTVRRRQRRKTPDDATFHRNRTDKYCWTHGACGHVSTKCKIKAPGHQDSATRENKMGGSTAFCTQ